MIRAAVFALIAFVSASANAIAVDPPMGTPRPIPADGMVVAPSMPSSPSAPSAPAPSAAVDYKKFRDPFKEPATSEVQELRSDLERFPANDFKAVAVITGPLRMRAMLLAPDGKTHYVSEKMKIGMREGVIVKITTKSLVIREKVVNPLGEVELFDTEIGIDTQPIAGAATQ